MDLKLTRLAHFLSFASLSLWSFSKFLLENQGRYWQWDGNLAQEAKTILHQVCPTIMVHQVKILTKMCLCGWVVSKGSFSARHTRRHQRSAVRCGKIPSFAGTSFPVMTIFDEHITGGSKTFRYSHTLSPLASFFMLAFSLRPKIKYKPPFQVKSMEAPLDHEILYNALRNIESK